MESSLSRLEKLVPESGEASITSRAGEVERLKQSVRLDIHDLADTLHTVEQAPHKYQLSDEELDSRRKFLDAAKRRFKVQYSLSHVDTYCFRQLYVIRGFICLHY